MPGEIVDFLERRLVDICCVTETRSTRKQVEIIHDEAAQYNH